MSQPYEAVVAELRDARSLLETIANSTEHADAAQKWELEKAELVGELRNATERLSRMDDANVVLGEAFGCYEAIKRYEKVIAKYEAK